jgi:hypothetical protein
MMLAWEQLKVVWYEIITREDGRAVILVMSTYTSRKVIGMWRV